VAYAYLLGLFDAMPTRDELVDLLAPVLRGELVETLDVTLGEPGCLEVPPGAGALALRVRYPDAPAASVRGLDPEDQWDWEAIERRLVAAGADRVPPVAGLRLELDVGPDDQA
jgi:hypothetical protein